MTNQKMKKKTSKTLNCKKGHKKFQVRIYLHQVADLRGGGGDGFNPCRPKGSPLFTILRYPLLVMDPKFFLKVPLAPIYTNFEGERAPKNAIFLSTFSKKSLKTTFLACFLKNLPALQKIWSKWGLYSDMGELRKSIWSS